MIDDLPLQTQLIVHVDTSHVCLVVFHDTGAHHFLLLACQLITSDNAVWLHAAAIAQHVHRPRIPPAQYSHSINMQRVGNDESASFNACRSVLRDLWRLFLVSFLFLWDQLGAQALAIRTNGPNRVEPHSQKLHGQRDRRVESIHDNEAHIAIGWRSRAEHLLQIANYCCRTGLVVG